MAASLDEIKVLLQDIQSQIPAIITAQRQVDARLVYNIGGLSDISEQLGLVQAGEFRTGNGKEPGFGFTGGRFGWPGFNYGGTLYFLVGITNDQLEVGMALEDGKFYAGEGSTIIDINGINIYEQAGDVNGQVRFFNDALPDNYGGITMWNELFMRVYYHDAATGQTSALRVDKDNISTHVNSRFRVVYEPTEKLAASLSAVSGQEGLTVYDVTDGTTNVAEILKPYWAMKAVTSSPDYVDGYARLFLYDTGTQTELRLRIKDGAVEKEHVIGGATAAGGFIEARDAININADANVDTYLRFRESSANQGYVWYDADLNNISLENENNGGIILVMDGSVATDFVSIYDRANAIDRFLFTNAGVFQIGTHHYLRTAASTETVFNEDGLDHDFRVESDTNANMLVVDAGLNGVGIGGAAENLYALKITGLLHVTGNVLFDGALTLGSLSLNHGLVVNGSFGNTVDDDFWAYSDSYSLFHVDAANNEVQISNATAGAIARFNNTEVVINDNGAATPDFRVEGDTDTSLLIVDAGLDAIGMGGAAETGKKLKVTGAAKITGAIEVGGGVVIDQISHSTYTPTLYNTTNIASSTAASTSWMRVGNRVTVAGRVTVDPTAAGACLLGMDLPIASALIAAAQVSGVAACGTVAGFSAAIEGDAANDRASFKWVAVDTASQILTFIFNYNII